MLNTAGILLGALALCQEPSSVPGAYHGPADETLLKLSTLQSPGGPENSLLWDLQGGWDRWEFWYESERDLLHRGEADFPPQAVGDDGRYGTAPWALDRQELLTTSMPLLLEALTSEQAAWREAAALSLGRIAYPASTPFLVRATKDPEASVRQAAYLALGLLATDETTTLLTTTFKESSEDSTRAFAALGLGLTGRSDAAATLRSYLNRCYATQSWKQREELLTATLLAAGVHGSRELNATLLNLSEEMAKDRGSQALLLTAIQTLGALHEPTSRAFLEAQLQSKRVEVAGAAAQALGRLGEAKAVVALGEALKRTHDPSLKGTIYLALGRLGGTAAQKLLLDEAPKRQEEEAVRSAHLIALGMSQAKGGYPKLLASFVHGSRVTRSGEGDTPRDEAGLRGAAAYGLALYGNPMAATRLSEVMQDPQQDPALRGYIATALGMIHSNKSVESLLILATDPTLPAATRRGLATGLGLCQRETTTAALLKLLTQDEDDSVRWAAAKALASVRSGSALATLNQALSQALQAEKASTQTAHLILGLGFLGDRHAGATLGSLLSGTDLRQDTRLFQALRAY